MAPYNHMAYLTVQKVDKPLSVCPIALFRPAVVWPLLELGTFAKLVAAS
jgi:hypothetical protein